MHTIAVIGAGTMGETLLSGLLRSGWAPDRLVATERRPDRAKELAERYPKGVKRASDFDWLSFSDLQVWEASRCYL